MFSPELNAFEFDVVAPAASTWLLERQLRASREMLKQQLERVERRLAAIEKEREVDKA